MKTAIFLRRKVFEVQLVVVAFVFAPIVLLLVPSANGFFRDSKGCKEGFEKKQQKQPNCQQDLVFEGTFRYQSESLPIDTTGRTTRAHSSSTSTSTSTSDGKERYGQQQYQREDLRDFFSDPKNRELLIKGGGNICRQIPLTPEWHELWTNQSKIVNSTPPKMKPNTRNHIHSEDKDDQNHTIDPNYVMTKLRNVGSRFHTNNGKRNSVDDKNRNCGYDEEILAVHTEVPIVPGLSLRTVSYTGCKTMKEDPTNALPYYEFTLLDETYEAVGKKSLTWIFDSVVVGKDNGNGNDGNNPTTKEDNETPKSLPSEGNGNIGTTGSTSLRSSSRNRQTYSLSRVTLQPDDGGVGYKICYYGHVKLCLSQKFLHKLPLPTKMVQSVVNTSIRKQLERECTRSIEKFSDALLRHHRWKTKHGTKTITH